MRIGKYIRGFLNYADIRPYQSFLYKGKYIEGKVDSVRLYYNLGLSREMNNKSILELGCNEGSICLLSAQDGASTVDGIEMNDVVYA